MVATINYRLGPLGFAAAGDGGANWGIQDQSAALEWWQKNAAEDELICCALLPFLGRDGG